MIFTIKTVTPSTNVLGASSTRSILIPADFVWSKTLGTYPALEAQGFEDTGTFNIGGPMVTAGGLVFIGATKDERFRAFDKATGEILWTYQLDAAGYATPATYRN